MDERKTPPGEWGKTMPGSLLARWPRDGQGELEPPVYLCHCTGRNMDEELTVSRMEGYGIPCLRVYPRDGAFGKLIIGVSGHGTDIFVPASLWADACELLNTSEEETEEE